MARTLPAPSARKACTRGRGAASQSEVGVWPSSTQRGTEGAKTEEGRKVEEGSKESEDDKDHNDED